MQCPRCLENTRQQWHKAEPATDLCPPQAESWECRWCGLWYANGAKPMLELDWPELERTYSRSDWQEWRDYQSREQLSHGEWEARFGGDDPTMEDAA